MKKVILGYPKLPIKFKEKWLAALRSGEFKKGKGYLEKEDKKGSSFCCLGVACKITHPKLDIKGKHYIENKVKKKTTKIPKILKGDDDDNILVKKLSEMNDSGKYSFNRIADWIEKNL